MLAKKIPWGSLVFHSKPPAGAVSNDAYFSVESGEVHLHVCIDGDWEMFIVNDLPKYGKHAYRPI